MTVTEILAVVSGLAIGYWLVGVFLPHARPPSDGGKAVADDDDQGA